MWLGYAVIRFKSNNVGYWMMHCHIDIHHGEGMAMIIQEGESEEIANLVNLNEVNLCENNLESVQIRRRGSQSQPQQPQLIEPSQAKDKLAALLQLFVEPIAKLISKLFSTKKA